VADTRVPLPARPGQPARRDDASEHQGTAHLGMVFAPLAGHRWVTVTERRTAVAIAPVLQALVAVHDLQAETLVLVRDTLDTHPLASWDEALAPAAARRLTARLARQDTPTPGSW
jgi:hypothetical protein